MKKKLNVGIFSFTGDEGCVIYFLEMLNERYKEWFELIDFKHARILKRKSIVKDIDVAFVEGAISSKKEEEKLKEVRNNSKRVVAIGSCAISGNPSNQRNFFNMETKQEIDFLLKRFNMNEKVLPISEFVKVDDVVPGCPMIEENFVEVLTKYLKEFNVVK
jgi:NAD-reducing hydrogenase small subunit